MKRKLISNMKNTEIICNVEEQIVSEAVGEIRRYFFSNEGNKMFLNNRYCPLITNYAEEIKRRLNEPDLFGREFDVYKFGPDESGLIQLEIRRIK